MTLYDLTKKYGEGKGEGTMWSTLSLVSDAIESTMAPSEKNALIRKVYGVMSGKHYNEDFANEDIAKMYYTDEDGNKHYGPYWPDDAVREIYNEHKSEIPDYNFWDFAVVMNMIKSDYLPLLDEWFPEDDEATRNERITRLATNWLQDPDNPLGTTTKAWCYFNSKG